MPMPPKVMRKATSGEGSYSKTSPMFVTVPKATKAAPASIRSAGWWATPTARSRDRGVDVVVGAGDRRLGVQAKQYAPSRAVSAPTVRECAGSRDELGLDGFLVVTTGRYTEPARRAAAALDVGLLRGEDLLRWDG